jgi:hypothetical protein
MQGNPVDPWIQAQIDAAIAPYVAWLPADDIAWMRERLAETLAEDPRAKDLAGRARPRAVVEESGEVRCGPLSEEAAPVVNPRRNRSG